MPDCEQSQRGLFIFRIMRKSNDITGQKFGRLTAISKVGKRGNHILWICQCACGNKYEATTNSLRHSMTRSCGCLRKGKTFNVKHGLSKSLSYTSWYSMMKRCLKPEHAEYKNYGGRGIEICDRWKNDFMEFYRDMGDRPIHHSLERIDVNGNYEPSNCKWATTKEQNSNKRCSVIIEYNGLKKCRTHWERYFGISQNRLREKIKKHGLEYAMNYFYKKNP